MNVDEATQAAKEYNENFVRQHFPLPSVTYSQRVAITLLAEVERLRAELAAAKADVERLNQMLQPAAQAASVVPMEMQNEQDGEQIAIKGMSHFYGDLWILHDGDEYFWLLDNYNGGDWQPITKQLYDALLDYNKRAKEADKTPPEA